MFQRTRYPAFLLITGLASALILQLPNISNIFGSVEKLTWKTVNDSAGLFTIQYPSKWEARNTTDPIGPIDVEFWYYGNTSSASDTYAYVTLIAWPNFHFTSTQQMIENDQLTVESEAENFKKKQGPECSSYIINEVQSCSIIYYSLTFPDQLHARNTLVVDAVDNSTGVQYSMEFTASEDVFEQFKPVFDHMVGSFELNSEAFVG
jgi:hypothetical protein